MKNRTQAAEARDKVLEALIEITDIPTPESIVEAEFKSREHDAVHAFDHDEDALTAHVISQGQTREEFDAELRESAVKSVKVQLLLDALAEANQVGVNQEEFTERVMFNSQRLGIAPEEYFPRLQEGNQLGAVFAEVRRGKALAGAVEQATVTNASGEVLDVAALFGIEADDEDRGAEELVADELAEEISRKSSPTEADRRRGRGGDRRGNPRGGRSKRSPARSWLSRRSRTPPPTNSTRIVARRRPTRRARPAATGADADPSPITSRVAGRAPVGRPVHAVSEQRATGAPSGGLTCGYCRVRFPTRAGSSAGPRECRIHPPSPAMWVIEEELSVSHRHPLAVSRAVQAIQRLEAIAPGLSAPMMRGTPGMSLSDSVSERLLRERIILLGSEVRDTNANEITSQLLLLAAEDPEKDITLYINSPGGSVTAGMAIYDTMMWIEPDVATTAMGLAASMGQFLLTAGAKGKRAALPHTRILMHQPSAGVGGTAADIAIQAEMLTKSKRELTELQSLHTGQPIERIEIDQDRDRWFTAQEALEYGFIDKVVARASDNTGGAAALATDADPDKPSLKK